MPRRAARTHGTLPLYGPGHPQSTPDQDLRERGRFRDMVGGPSRHRARDLDQDPQERLGPAVDHARAGARRRLVLGLDRRPPEGIRRTILSAALLPAWAKE